jgi:hypothetical protein
MYLMLSSHPDLVGLDENEADYELPPWLVMAVNSLLGKKTVYKLPPVIWQVDKFMSLYSDSQNGWVSRHPLSVISSMKNLYFEQEQQSWLQRFGQQELERAAVYFPHLKQLAFQEMSEAEIAARLWVAKQRMSGVYRNAGLRVVDVRYEDLVSDSEITAKKVLKELGLAWHPRVLEHHRHHGAERHPGGTMGNKPINPARAKPQLNLSEQERQTIGHICHETMLEFGYGAEP